MIARVLRPRLRVVQPAAAVSLAVDQARLPNQRDRPFPAPIDRKPEALRGVPVATKGERTSGSQSGRRAAAPSFYKERRKTR